VKPLIYLLCVLPLQTSQDRMHNERTSTLSPSNTDGNLVHDRYQRSSTMTSVESDSSSFMSLDTNRCKPNTSFIWCLPQDYNQEKHPFTYFHLANRVLPWDYDFRFVIEEISNINDKAQTMSISMYFAVSWMEPRLQINESATEWSEAITGPKNQVNESPESLKYIWYPELEIYGLDTFGRQRVLKEMSGVRIIKNKTITYELGVRITISCRMNFDDYPLDAHTCQFQVGSYYDTHETVTCSSFFIYDLDRQRSLQHFIQIERLPEKFKVLTLPSGIYAACGFQVRLQRKQMQFLVQVYLPSFMFVIVSWVSFLIKPEVVPGRMALLVTLFLVLINIFNSVRENAPISSRLNAIDLYLVVCIFLVFGALMEYAVILLMLKKRRKPKRTIDQGLRHLFAASNGAAAVPMRDTNTRETLQAHSGGGRNQVEVENSVLSNNIHKKSMLVSYANNQAVITEAVQNTQQKQYQLNGEGYYTVDQINKPTDIGLSARKQALVDNIDAWAMWISPPMFILWNICYWIAYRHVDTELI